MAEPKMISMKRTPADKRGDKLQTAPAEAMAPDYPWGLCLHMDREELDKLGMKDLPKVGTEMTITAKVKVTRVSQSAVEGANDESSIDMQITDIAL